VYTNDANAAGKAFIKITSQNYSVVAPVGVADFYCHTINATGNIIATSIAVIKTVYPGTGDIVSLNQQGRRLQFLINVFYTDNLLVRHRKSDIIFPFHYFW
jgi:hypothetical protein